MPQATDLFLQSTIQHYLSYGKPLPSPAPIQRFSCKCSKWRRKKIKDSPNLGKCFPVADPCRPRFLQALLSSPHSSEQRLLGIGCGRSFYRLTGAMESKSKGTIKTTWRSLLLRNNLVIPLQEIHPSGSTLYL